MTVLTLGQNTGDTSGVADTWITEAEPTTSKAGDTALEVSDFGAVDRHNTILRPDLTALPSGATVNSVSVKLFLVNQSTNDPRTMVARRLLKPAVVAQATWDIYATGLNWTVAGGEDNADAVATPSASFDLSAVTDGTYAVITSAGLATDVQGWKNSTFANYGWIFTRSDDPESGRYAVFASSEGDDGQRPQVVIDYTAGGTRRKLVGLLMG